MDGLYIDIPDFHFFSRAFVLKHMDFSAKICNNVPMMKGILKLIFKDEVQEIFDHFSAIFDVKILFYSTDGDVVKVGLNRPNSQYCDLIQRKLYGRKACLEIDAARRNEAKTREKTISYCCHAGLDESLTPIYIDGCLLGFLGFGQFRTSQEISSKVVKDWSQKYDPTDLINAYNQLPFYSKEKEKHLLGLLSILVKYIVSHRMITVKGDFLLQKIITFIQENLNKSISLKDVAMFAGRSESTISHLFQKKLNTSFKQTVINMKLDRADEYLRSNPHTKIRDVSERVGYDDPLYFSRLYKKNRKLTPRQYQQKFQKL
jgi:AraC-like DNA-binding protein